MKWSRNTKEFEYKAFTSEDGRYRVQDINDQPCVPEYNELKKHNWDSKKTHEAFLTYCKANKISLNGANWALIDNKTNEVIRFPFKTAKSAMQYAETI